MCCVGRRARPRGAAVVLFGPFGAADVDRFAGPAIGLAPLGRGALEDIGAHDAVEPAVAFAHGFASTLGG
jgi:hypothetical protein